VTSVLKKRWVDKPRPGRIHGVDNSVSRIGLIVDCTTFPVNRPVGRFEESKIYKKEVAVMGKAPHFALFSSRGEVGSRHDITIFKRNLGKYAKYLESVSNPGTFWDLCADKGYTDQSLVTPFKRIIPKKSNMENYSPTENEKPFLKPEFMWNAFLVE